MSAVVNSNLPHAAPDRTRLAVALIVGSMLLLSGMDAGIKGLTDEFSLWQVCAARAVFSVPILTIIVAMGGTAVLRQVLRPWVMLRSLLIVGAWIAYYAAIPVMDLSVAATALYTIPLFIAGFAAVFAGEPVGWRRWSGIVIGFAGVIVILRPGGDAFSLFALLPVLAALLYALAAVITRNRCPTESPYVLALGLNAGLLVTGIVGSIGVVLLVPDASDGFLLRHWHPMDLTDWTIMAAFGIVMVAITAGVAKAYQSGPSAIVGTFDYSYLAFVSLWGVLFFSERLDAPIATGILLIVAAGLLVLWQPRRNDVAARAS
ncbi:MAG: DMT family transporter [Rhodospirillaceae bacterium]|nr:DMT family transporter [Rhodospirillaceae bacterium]